MSITDELRDYAEDWDWVDTGAEKAQDRIEAIADRIDAEHEEAIASMMNDALYHANDKDMADLGWVKLPKDADGEVWHVGDFVVGEVNPRNPKAIERMLWYGPDSGWQLETDTIIYPCPDRPRHHHAPTVEDVLRDMLDSLDLDPTSHVDAGAVVAECAARLRLREDA